MRKGQINDSLLNVIFIATVIIVWLGLMCLVAEQEAKQFNRFSKTQITWWDALWADYRIIPN